MVSLAVTLRTFMLLLLCFSILSRWLNAYQNYTHNLHRKSENVQLAIAFKIENSFTLTLAVSWVMIFSTDTPKFCRKMANQLFFWLFNEINKPQSRWNGSIRKLSLKTIFQIKADVHFYARKFNKLFIQTESIHFQSNRMFVHRKQFFIIIQR